jgi:hypothetical protein
VLAPFSFFVTSIQAMRDLSGSQDGFGGDLRYGETGEGAGLRGADKICAAIAERSMPDQRQTVARFNTVAGPVHFKDRVGAGLVRPDGTAARLEPHPAADDPAERRRGGDQNDLPNEDGIPTTPTGHPAAPATRAPTITTLTGTGSTARCT